MNKKNSDCMLALNALPQYRFSSYRYFEAEEKHVCRICPEDVIVFVFGGILKFSENGIPVEVGEGKYYIQRAGLYQSGDVPSIMPRYFYIHFSGTFVRGEIGERGSGKIPISGHFGFSELKEHFDRLNVLRNDVPGSEFQKQFCFEKILDAISSPPTEAGEGDKLAATVKAELERSPLSDISIDRLCESLSYSKSYIIRVFRRRYGVSPYEYMIGVRLERARQLLLASSLSCQRISDECGFPDYSVFYRQFHVACGVSPSEWRKSRYRIE
ncbi:MAG TPA: AraC family transcriptional regulator [Bacillota bacterium]|nr:AraC family transcriptional regulator [Bacillota bacterium]